MKIGGFLPSSLIDYPRKISAVIFAKGCSFQCPFCYNPDIVLGKTEDVSEETVFETLKAKKKWLDGVVLGGGEPTIYEDLPDFISRIKKLGFFVKLDTNGSNPSMLEKLIKSNLINYIAMDIKAPLEKYESVVRRKVNLDDIKKSVEIIRNSRIDYEFRTTLVPSLHSEEDIVKMANLLKGSKKYFIQQFRVDKTLDKGFEKEKPYRPEELKDFVEKIKSKFEICEVRGI